MDYLKIVIVKNMAVSWDTQLRKNFVSMDFHATVYMSASRLLTF